MTGRSPIYASWLLRREIPVSHDANIVTFSFSPVESRQLMDDCQCVFVFLPITLTIVSFVLSVGIGIHCKMLFWNAFSSFLFFS